MRIAIIGSTGAVGQELLHLLPSQELVLFDSKSPISFEGIDLAFFCVKSEIAKKLIPIARASKTICIDASTAFRHDPSVPLVIPEINAHTLERHQGVIASPNCTTTIMLLPLAPLHKKFQIRRIVAVTYQAVSGAGTKGIKELHQQSEKFLRQEPLSAEVFPTPCAFNVFPHESPQLSSGYVEEEQKMHEETRRILEDDEIRVTATCVRVPVFRVHSASLNVEFARPIDKHRALELLSTTPGVFLKENASALDASGQKPIFCGRIREDHTQPNTLEMWVMGDQLLKGAALNMVQIAEALCLI